MSYQKNVISQHYGSYLQLSFQSKHDNVTILNQNSIHSIYFIGWIYITVYLHLKQSENMTD